MSGFRLSGPGNGRFDSFLDVGHPLQLIIMLNRIEPKDSKLAERFSVAGSKTTGASLGGSVNLDDTGIVGEAIRLQFGVISPRPLGGNLVSRGLRSEFRMRTINRRVDTVVFSQSTLPLSLILTAPPFRTRPSISLSRQFRFTCPQKSIHQKVAWKRLSFDNGDVSRV